jgi:hypothetical protein
MRSRLSPCPFFAPKKRQGVAISTGVRSEIARSEIVRYSKLKYHVFVTHVILYVCEIARSEILRYS